MARSSPPRRKSASREVKHDPSFPHSRWPPASRAGRAAARRRRLRRLLRQAVSEVRAAAGDLSGLCSARSDVVSARPCRSGSRRNCSRRILLVRELHGGRPDKWMAEKLLFAEHHFSHAASAFFPSPFERGRRADDGRRRRMGNDHGRDRARQRPENREGNPLSRIRWVCSIPRSPTTPASRSIPANTR